MSGMASQTVLLAQLLVKASAAAGSGQCAVLGVTPANLGQHMAGNTAAGRSAMAGLVAGEAVFTQRLVRRGEVAGRQHGRGVQAGEGDEHSNCPAHQPARPAAVHRQPQKSAMATKCATVSRLKASVMGKWTARQRLTTSRVSASRCRAASCSAVVCPCSARRLRVTPRRRRARSSRNLPVRPLVTLISMAAVAIQGSQALKCTPAWTSTSKDPDHARYSWQRSNRRGLPYAMSLRLRSEYANEATMSNTPGIPR